MPEKQRIYFDPEKFKALRERKGWSQQQLANWAKINVSAIKDYENSEATRGCQRETFKKLVKVVRWEELKRVVREGQQIGEQWAEEVKRSQPRGRTQEKPKIFPNILPPEPDLIGRDDQLEAVKERLFTEDKRNRFALHGIPGVGKTAVALKLVYDSQVQERFKDGILWVGLGRDGDALAQLGSWAGKLGISPEALKGLTTVEKRAREIRAAIGERRMLLVVDDVWEEKAALDFYVGGPRCVHLVTTRWPKVAVKFARKGGTIPVTELTEEDGLRLLQRWAEKTVDTEPEAARELVRAVGCLPLALILMGKYLETEEDAGRPRIQWALEQLQKVETRLRHAEPQLPLEQHTSLPEGAYVSLEAVIQLSEESLDGEARRAFRALSVFPAKPNTFSEEAALAVAAVLNEVVYKIVDTGLLEPNEQGRYFLHQTIADYGRIRGADEAASERMAGFFVNYIGQHERNYGALDQEMSNILAALEMASAYEMRKELIQGTNGLYHFLEVRGLYGVAEKLLTRAHELAKAADNAIDLVVTQLNLGSLAEKRANYPQAKIYLEEGLEKTRELGRREWISKFLLILGRVRINTAAIDQGEAALIEGLGFAEELELWEDIGGFNINLGGLRFYLGQYDQAEKDLKEGLRIAEKLGLRDRVCGVMVTLSAIALGRGDYKKAEDLCEEGLAISRQLGLHETTAKLLINKGLSASNRGLYEQAWNSLEEGLVLARRFDMYLNICMASQNLGAMAVNQGKYAQAKGYLEEALTTAHKYNLKQSEVAVLRDLGGLFSKQGLNDQAEVCLKKALKGAQKFKLSENVCSALLALGGLALKRSLLDQAKRHLKKGLKIAQRDGFKEYNGAILIKLGSVATEQEELDQAERYLMEAEKIIQSIDDVWWKSAQLIAWGELHLKRGVFDLTENSFAEALRKAQEAGMKELVGEALYGLARVALAPGNITEARRQGQESLVIFEGIGHGDAAEVREWVERLPN